LRWSKAFGTPAANPGTAVASPPALSTTSSIRRLFFWTALADQDQIVRRSLITIR